MPCECFLLIRRQRRPCLLAIDDGLSLAGKHAGRGTTYGRDSVFLRGCDLCDRIMYFDPV